MLLKLIESRRRRAEGGFTLIELLVVIVILGILAAVVVFAVRGTGDRGAKAALATDWETIATAEEAHCARFGTYATMDQLVSAGFLSQPSTLHSVQPDNGGDVSCARTSFSGAPGAPPAPAFQATCDPAKAPACGTPGSGGGLPAPEGTGHFSQTGTLNVPRNNHSTTLLADGKVLVAGGQSGVTSTILTSAEIYDPVTGAWTPTGSLNEARWIHTAALLSDGRVLVAGVLGGNPVTTTNSKPFLDSAEIYNPATGTWSVTGSLNVRRGLHTDAVLSDGRVLVAGGRSCTEPPPTTCSFTVTTATAEIYNPATGIWTPTDPMAASRHTTSAARLTDGRVLVPGGFGGAGGKTADVYDPATGTWTRVADLNVSRNRQGAILLPDGKVLVAAGTGSTLNSSEFYDPAANTWTLSGLVGQAGRINYHHKVLPNGKVLVAGGAQSGFSGAAEVKTSELYDIATGKWTAGPGMRDFHGVRGTFANTGVPEVILLTTNCGSNCGKVLFAGNNASGISELYVPPTP